MRFFDENYFNKLKQITLDYIGRNYDLCYLKAMHEELRCRGANTIIVGSSHAMNGLLAGEMSASDWGKTVNLSISSQDIWFDYQNAKKAVAETATPIRNCIINFGYYMMYQDLSRSGNLSYMLPCIYAHIFGCGEAMHHMNVTGSADLLNKMQYDRELFPDEIIRPLCEYWTTRAFMEQGEYYGYIKTREQNSALGLKKVLWQTLDEYEKTKVASERADIHNAMKKYTASKEENDKLLQEIILFLHRNGIRTFVVITPFTGFYNRFIDPSMKKEIETCLEEVPVPVEYLDMNDYPDCFSDGDFIDADHLNAEGAVHVTAFLNSYLRFIDHPEDFSPASPS